MPYDKVATSRRLLRKYRGVLANPKFSPELKTYARQQVERLGRGLPQGPQGPPPPPLTLDELQMLVGKRLARRASLRKPQQPPE